MEEIKILCVDDESNVLRTLERLFFEEEYSIITAGSGAEGLKRLEQEQFQIIISDYRMPEMNGVDFFREVRRKWPETVRIVLSGYADVASIVSAINEGEIYKFIPKPWNDDELIVTVANAVEKYNLEQENKKLTVLLIDKNRELEEFNEKLESLVIEKTTDLRLQNTVLELSQKILDVLPIGIAGVDNEGTIVQINDFAQKVLKSANSTLLGEQAESVFTCETMSLINKVKMKDKLIGSAEGYDFSGSVVCVPLYDGRDQKGCIIIFDPEQD